MTFFFQFAKASEQVTASVFARLWCVHTERRPGDHLDAK
jgi:hypothetical protein